MQYNTNHLTIDAAADTDADDGDDDEDEDNTSTSTNCDSNNLISSQDRWS